tara:strand:+ start:253 stop:885 length:633 start_codon:yes stop_codon:yes gene_type:complete
MAFHDVQLPVEVEQGAMGGPSFKTTVLELSSGFEKRNIDWQRTRGDWDVSYGIRNKAGQEAVLAFFYARQAKAHTFRFKDWTDFEIGDDVTDAEQEIDIADGVRDKFQIVRRYTDAGATFDREITRPVAPVRVFFDSVEQFAGFTVDIATGVVDFTVAPTAAVSIGIICEFDIPVRFDIDHLDLRAFTADAYSLPALPIKEVRETLVDVS